MWANKIILWIYFDSEREIQYIDRWCLSYKALNSSMTEGFLTLEIFFTWVDFISECHSHEQSNILCIVLFKKMKWPGKIWTKYFLSKTFLQGAGHKLNTKAVRDKSMHSNEAENICRTRGWSKWSVKLYNEIKSCCS